MHTRKQGSRVKLLKAGRRKKKTQVCPHLPLGLLSANYNGDYQGTLMYTHTHSHSARLPFLVLVDLGWYCLHQLVAGLQGIQAELLPNLYQRSCFDLKGKESL